MGVLESAKEKIEKMTGWKRPSRGDLRDAVRSRKPNSFRFKDDGVVPNNPKLPLILYRSPVSLADDRDPAAVFEELFARNGWRDSWRNGIYDYMHYHASTHEVLGVARGHAKVRFGGERGKALHLKAGDVVVLPAGTGVRTRRPAHASLAPDLARQEPSRCGPFSKTRRRTGRSIRRHGWARH